jgi:hypothetical protein
MEWKNVHRDSPPGHGQEILLSVDGIYYITQYDSEKNVYRLRDEPLSYFSPADRSSMYWLMIDEPPMAPPSGVELN